mgnify:CR=1 FL=1
MEQENIEALTYLVTGVDPTGREFRGLYNREDARYLARSSRLNKVMDMTTKTMIEFI